MKYSIRPVVVSMVAGLGMALSAQAGIVTTLPTAALDANTTFTFSSQAVSAMSFLGLGASALGNATTVGGNAWSFNMPVTQVTTSLNLLPLSLTPISGKATGSGLDIHGPDGRLALANFSLDFQRNMMTADVTTAAGVTKGMDLYSFHVADGLKISSNGGLSLTMAMDQMYMTAGARATFIDALQLPDFTDAVMSKLDFGKMTVAISPSLRMGLKVADKTLSPNIAVPEAPSMAYMMLGLFGVALVSRRKQPQ